MRRKWGAFLLGVIVGAGLIYFALNFHVIRAGDGMHVVRKVDAQLASTYVDIREFAPRDWADHPEIFTALANAGRQDLIESAAHDALRNGMDQWLKGSVRDR